MLAETQIQADVEISSASHESFRYHAIGSTTGPSQNRLVPTRLVGIISGLSPLS